MKIRIIQSVLIILFVLSTMVHAEQRTLNMKDADIRALITQVAEMTGYNFIVDPRVKGTVTVISSRPMDAEEIYEVFLSILRVHGFSAVKTGSVVKVIPDASAKQTSIPTADEGVVQAPDEMVTRVLQVQNVAAPQLIPILRPLVPQYGHLAAYPPTNVIIISDRASNIERLVNIIQKIDKASTEEIEIIHMEHASAAEIVRLIQNLEKQSAAGADKMSSKGARVVADERTNSVLLTGEEAARVRYRGLIARLDQPLQAEGNTQVIYLKYASAVDLVAILDGISSSIADEESTNGASGEEPNVTIQADEATNSLILSAPPDIQRSLQAVISKLDIRRPQVLVEAIIVEIQDKRARELGLQWALQAGESYAGTQFNNQTNSPIGKIIDRILAFQMAEKGSKIGTDGFAAPILGNGGSLGAFNIDLGGVSFGVLAQALANDVYANILSTPTILTLDNVEAEIKVGSEVPFITGKFTTNTSGKEGSVDNPFQSIERQDVGLTLRVTPHINEGGAITLEVDQTVSDISKDVQVAADTVTDNKVIKTTILVEDGEMVVLGGLITSKLRETEQKVPLLGDIPLLGQLFKSRETSVEKQNLMVFLRPRVLRDSETQMHYSREKYEAIKDYQSYKNRAGVQLMPNEEPPLLQEWDERLALPPSYKGDLDVNEITS